MTRRKYVLHEYAADQGKITTGQVKPRKNLKDQPLKTRVKVSDNFDFSI
jgi:hypothetical protein